MPQTIHTQRLTLRPLNADDAAAVADFVGELYVSRWLTRVRHPYSVADGEDFIARTASEPFHYCIEYQGEFAGVMSIMEELGYWLGRPFWGQGLATEAAEALVSHYFDQDHTGIRSGHVIGNDASRNVLLKLGFVDQKIESTPSVSLGCNVDVQKMYLARDKWRGAA